ncbi:MAG: YidC/Oxa1 family insertase periplasmic-domain containing protein, partial [Bacteroidia bacterium]|nr:YidC/Oxa1 family insertase periplasmic-domain containing protein [Bacteroidia bacterium]
MMDKKSTIGLVIIGLILAGWVYFSGPSKEQKAAQQAAFKRAQDSTVKAENERKVKEAAQIALNKKNTIAGDTSKTASIIPAGADTSKKAILSADSLKIVQKKAMFLDFYPATIGTDENVTIENEKIKVTISTKSGRVNSVVLKEYLRADKKTPVELFEKGNSDQKLILNAYESSSFSTSDLYFTPPANKAVVVKGL